MKKPLLLFILTSSIYCSYCFANDTEVIRYAVKKCEKSVAEFCITSNICTDYCNTVYRKSSQKKACKKQCTPSKRCKAKAPDECEIDGNRELDQWTSDLLLQCIAEERDIDANTTGRRMIHWRNIMTPSLGKILNIPALLDI